MHCVADDRRDRVAVLIVDPDHQDVGVDLALRVDPGDRAPAGGRFAAVDRDVAFAPPPAHSGWRHVEPGFAGRAGDQAGQDRVVGLQGILPFGCPGPGARGWAGVVVGDRGADLCRGDAEFGCDGRPDRVALRLRDDDDFEFAERCCLLAIADDQDGGDEVLIDPFGEDVGLGAPVRVGSGERRGDDGAANASLEGRRGHEASPCSSESIRS